MGLCKCPKKVVTTLFCYEHRVNVCQRCLATNHPQCVVQSYLEWLKDSDYDPTCKLCSEPLASKECIRLICLHLFHWQCLDQYCSSLPSTTAPAGYKCEHCETSVFPPANVSSLIADYCREKLASVNWGRRGLGLPLLSQDGPSISGQDFLPGFVESSSTGNPPSSMPRPWLENHDGQSPRKDSTVVHFVEDQIHARGLDGQAPRRTHSSLDDVAPLDADDDKYARRAAKPLSWFKWFQRRVASRRCTLTRVLLLLLSFTVIFVLFLTIDMTHIPE